MGSPETEAPSGPVESARTCTAPSGSTVLVAFRTRFSVTPSLRGTGQVTGSPARVTSPAGIGVQVPASPRRHENDTPSYRPGSPCAASGTRAAVRTPSSGRDTAPAPTGKRYSTESEVFSAPSTVRAHRELTPAFGGAAATFTGAVPVVAPPFQVTWSQDRSIRVCSLAGGLTVNAPGCPAFPDQVPVGYAVEVTDVGASGGDTSTRNTPHGDRPSLWCVPSYGDVRNRYRAPSVSFPAGTVTALGLPLVAQAEVNTPTSSPVADANTWKLPRTRSPFASASANVSRRTGRSVLTVQSPPESFTNGGPASCATPVRGRWLYVTVSFGTFLAASEEFTCL